MTVPSPQPATRRPPIASRLPSWLAPAASAGALAAGCVIVALVDPREEGGFYPTCPFLAVTGWWCPGCGSLRAANRALNGDLLAAFSYNPLTMLLAPLLGYAWLRWVLRAFGGAERWPPPTLTRRDSEIFMVVAALFWILRNVPGFGLLAPG
jgi:hypothetical protein